MPSGLSVAFIDIGQGDATIVQLPGNTDGIMIDCGKTGTHQVYSYLEASGIQRLRLVLLSHSDDDHVGGIMGVLDNFRGVVDEIAFNPDRLGGQSGNRQFNVFLRQLAQFVRSHPCVYRFPALGDNWSFGEVVLHVLHPDVPDRLEALARNLRNDAAVVLLIEFEGERILLASDVQAVGWQWIADRNTDITARVFKLPHHGGWFIGSQGLAGVLLAVQPKVIVVSVGNPNPYQHPATETLQALIDYVNGHEETVVLCTQLAVSPHLRITAEGTIRVNISAGRVSVSTTATPGQPS